MPLNFQKFFNLARLTDLRPAIALNTVYFLLAVFGLMAIAGIVLKLIQKNKKFDAFAKRLLEKYFVMLTTMGSLGILLTWFRYERAYILSARFLLLVWFAGLVVWLVFVLKYQFKTIPQARADLQKTQEFKKYLPKRK